jgi:hypothetical protein
MAPGWAAGLQIVHVVVGGSLQEAQQLDRERHDEGAVLLRRHLGHGLQQAQLQGRRIHRHRRRRLRELLRRLELSVG